MGTERAGYPDTALNGFCGGPKNSEKGIKKIEIRHYREISASETTTFVSSLSKKKGRDWRKLRRKAWLVRVNMN